MNTSADTACIRTGVDQQNIHQKICLKTHDEFLMNYKESLQESVQCEVRRRISKHNCRTAHRGSVLFLGPVDRVPVELRSPRKNKKNPRDLDRIRADSGIPNPHPSLLAHIRLHTYKSKKPGNEKSGPPECTALCTAVCYRCMVPGIRATRRGLQALHPMCPGSPPQCALW